MFAKTVDQLMIYKKALTLSSELKKRIRQIPHYWTIDESNQLIRSSGSVPSNIAEGFGQRFYPNQFIRYLNIALGSSDESQHHVQKLMLDKHLSIQEGEEWKKKYKGLSINILNFICYLEKRQNKPKKLKRTNHHLTHH